MHHTLVVEAKATPPVTVSLELTHIIIIIITES